MSVWLIVVYNELRVGREWSCVERDVTRWVYVCVCCRHTQQPHHRWQCLLLLLCLHQSQLLKQRPHLTLTVSFMINSLTILILLCFTQSHRSYIQHIRIFGSPACLLLLAVQWVSEWVQSLILIRRREWSGRIASLPLFGCLSSFLSFFCFYRLAYKSRRRMNRHRSTLIRRVLCQGCAFWGLEYSIFTFLPIFRQKSSKWSLK